MLDNIDQIKTEIDAVGDEKALRRRRKINKLISGRT